MFTRHKVPRTYGVRKALGIGLKPFHTHASVLARTLRLDRPSSVLAVSMVPGKGRAGKRNAVAPLC